MNMYPEFMYAKSLPYYAQLLTVVTTVYCVFELVTIFLLPKYGCDPVTALLSCW